MAPPPGTEKSGLRCLAHVRDVREAGADRTPVGFYSLGHARSSSQTSAAQHATYRGGRSLASARRTAFLEIPRSREIALIAIPSDLCSRRISAQFSTVITLHRVTQGVELARR